MAEIKRISLTLFMSSPLHAEAWRLLQKTSAGQRTEAICLAVCREHDREMMLKMVREAVGQKDSTERKKQTKQTARAGDVGDDVLGYLRSLQNGGDNT